ncbi:unnamed protein product (macronuclear) [Paramecium tetraurelia]|uniref:Transmembrane protein n=1 Tax=Paramecium tetraurelia TaxID=5888 RepID=A0BP65_PARTE|nr:uncharacterized protein GSPATT00005081001 [Paramecium tetraurelia]CAK60332.1 unnamed protein product [Paramecium tetraurelia]|eukprot:XP_001427730.1 hypothetical protein (macronuclear) [Paramecium tetraurelia strain d4-2]
MKQDQNQQQPVAKKKSVPFSKKLKRAKRHFIKFLNSPSTIQGFYFCIQTMFNYIGIASLLLLIYYFLYQSFIYFIIVSSILSLFYVTYQGVNIIHYKTIGDIQNFDDTMQESQKDAQNETKGCKYYCKMLGITIASLLLLDLPILNFQITKQVKLIEDQLQLEDERYTKKKKQANKVQDKQPQIDVKQLTADYAIKIASLRTQKKQRQWLIPYKFGFSAIFGYIPAIFVMAVWLIGNQQQIDVFGKLQNIILTTSYGCMVFASVICLYEIQFFDKSASTLKDAFKWFLCRYVELLCKSLLIGYYIKFSEFETIPLLIIGVGYLIYSISCTFLFTLFDYQKSEEVNSSQQQSVERQDDEKQDGKIQENQEQPIEKGVLYVIKSYIKSLFLNIYARTLFLPYKESALGMKTLSFYQVTFGIDKKMIREEVASDGWKNWMITYDQSKKFGLPRRSYTHIVQSLRFFELFHLALFSICQNIIQGQYLEIVEPKKVSLYYSGKIVTVASIVILLFYYLRAGYRTIHEKQLDITGIDE